eukprot:6476881-Amphidinium_carterae.2
MVHVQETAKMLWTNLAPHLSQQAARLVMPSTAPGNTRSKLHMWGLSSSSCGDSQTLHVGRMQ